MPVHPQQIIEFLGGDAARPLKAKELARGLGVEQADYAEFKELLQRMEDEGLLYRVQRQRYAAPGKINLVVGRFRSIRSGAGFVEPEAGGDDVFIPAEAKESAVDRDKVVARIERRRRGQRVEGTVIRVLERARERIVGLFHAAGPEDRPGDFGFVVPNDRKLTRDVYVRPGGTLTAQPGDLVVVTVTDWGSDHRGPAGTIEEVIGPADAPGNDIVAIVHGHDLSVAFPPEVITEAESISARGITEEDLVGRTDLREHLVFTIDPADAKDHDDALSIEAVGDDGWDVGVHIADVSFYVRPGSPLDLEALNRGTSVYLVDRVIPMLPHELSSDLCSLRPDVDRLAMTLLMRIDNSGALRSQRLVRSVIRSRQKLSYDEAQEVLDGRRSIDTGTDNALRNLLALSRTLRRARAERGSIDFDLPEARVVLAESGEPTDIQRVLRLDSHRLIEDFMLLANETIARTAAKRKIPIPYRIHEPPDAARIEQLREFVASFGLRMPARGKPSPKDLQKLLEQARGRPEEKLLSTVVLRSMKQARYSEENLGHFGLAASHYAHFTSPIRRYPDLLLHRICALRFLDQQGTSPSAEAIAPIAKLSSERERVAVAAERDSVELKKVQYMERHLGDEFAGSISDVRAFGFFVVLDDVYVDGLVHVSSLDDDYYGFQEDAYALVGQNTGRTFRLGDRVRVQVATVDREARRIDFRLLSAEAGSGARSGRGGRSGRRSGSEGPQGTGGKSGGTGSGSRRGGGGKRGGHKGGSDKGRGPGKGGGGKGGAPRKGGGGRKRGATGRSPSTRR
ncbi:MAG: ribonuclease R [Longimicrobiales bacterium]